MMMMMMMLTMIISLETAAAREFQAAGPQTAKLCGP